MNDLYVSAIMAEWRQMAAMAETYKSTVEMDKMLAEIDKKIELVLSAIILSVSIVLFFFEKKQLHFRICFFFSKIFFWSGKNFG